MGRRKGQKQIDFCVTEEDYLDIKALKRATGETITKIMLLGMERYKEQLPKDVYRRYLEEKAKLQRLEEYHARQRKD